MVYYALVNGSEASGGKWGMLFTFTVVKKIDDHGKFS
jgi:hypothetical protein